MSSPCGSVSKVQRVNVPQSVIHAVVKSVYEVVRHHLHVWLHLLPLVIPVGVGFSIDVNEVTLPVTRMVRYEFPSTQSECEILVARLWAADCFFHT